MDILGPINKEFKELDRFISKSSLDKRELVEAKKKVRERSLVPVVSHAFTRSLAEMFYESFKVQFMADRKLLHLLQGHEINTKPGAKNFCGNHGVNYPATYLSSVSVRDITEEIMDKGVCVKKVDGAGGIDVFGIVKSASGYLDVFSGKFYEDYASILGCLSEVFGGDLVEVEELLIGDDGKPAVDIKFFSFYGECPLILQIDRWGGERRKNYFFESNGDRVFPRSDAEKDHCSRAAEPLYDERLLSLAKEVSCLIPAPFCRIDFMDSRDGPFLGEFTFNIGGPGKFYDKWDKILGREYSLAKVRLHADLINGKQFPEFRQ